VNSRVIIRQAIKDDLAAMSFLRHEAILETNQQAYSQQQLLQWSRVQPTKRTRTRITDGCVLIGTSRGQIVASNSLDLDQAEMVGLFISPAFQGQGLGRRMVGEIERLAIQFGMTQLRVEAASPAIGFYRHCDYLTRPGATTVKDPRTKLDSLSMLRSFPQRQTRYGSRIRNLLNRLGIPQDYGRRHRLRLQLEARELATIGTDNQAREQMLDPKSAMAWYEMRNAAQVDGVTLLIASAYRSVGYQLSIIQRKRLTGQTTNEILRVSAAPGFSEHHTGHAIDICSPDRTPLEECFENTLAFEWLTESARDYGFRLSYPRNNRHEIAYEPWHWYHHTSKASDQR